MSNPPLHVTIVPHREFLPADASEQKLFVMLKLQPTKEVALQLPSTSFVFTIDTSGSMGEVVKGGKTKLDIVIESLLSLVRSNQLGANDRVAILQFDDRASAIIELTPATQTSQLEEGIKTLRNYSGGTNMGKGMEQTLKMLADRSMTSRRALIFTDGETFDEEECRTLAKQFADKGIPITALGVGEFNEDLLIDLSNTTAGHLHHIVSGEATGTDVAISDLPQTLWEEFSQAQQEVINNLALTVKTVKGVKLSRVVRAYPDQAEFPLNQEPYPIGTAVAHDETVFILEFTIDSHASSRVRIAQLGLTYDIPGQNRRGELPPQNLVVQFVTGQSGAAQVDREVMGYVQQCNISQLVTEATQVADSNPQEAERLLETARRMTVKIGNQAMLESLNEARDELRKTSKISSGTRKTIKMGSRGKTIKMSGDINSEFSEEQIRKLSGT